MPQSTNAQKPSPITPEAAPETVAVRPGGCPTAATLTRVVDSAELFGDARTVLIQHAGEQYRLIVTKNDKLLLQK